MSTSYVDIRGINKVELLYALWYNTGRVASDRQTTILQPTFDFALANNVVYGYIDEFMGVAIKSDLSKNLANTNEYDKCAGKKGLFKEIVNSITYRKLPDECNCVSDACANINLITMN
jgi:hypothetical protein